MTGSDSNTPQSATEYYWTELPKFIAAVYHAIATSQKIAMRPSDSRRQYWASVLFTRLCYLFCGSDGGGESAAAIYTLLGMARLNGVDPERWLREVLRRIADHPLSRIEELLPWNMTAELQPTPEMP